MLSLENWTVPIFGSLVVRVNIGDVPHTRDSSQHGSIVDGGLDEIA